MPYIYVMIDGDDTYEAAHLPEMIDTLLSGPYDHVLGVRQDNQETTSYRPGHEAGNRMFNGLTGWLFRLPRSPTCSPAIGCSSRRFVKSFPVISRRFEIETELTVHTMSLRLPSTEVPSTSEIAPTAASRALDRRGRLPHPRSHLRPCQARNAEAVVLRCSHRALRGLVPGLRSAGHLGVLAHRADAPISDRGARSCSDGIGLPARQRRADS